MSITNSTPITGVTKEGKRVWYTGKSGQEFVCEDYKKTFLGYTLEGARRQAAKLNKMTPIHGVHFTAVVGNMVKFFYEEIKD